MTPPATDLGELLAALAVDAINVQLLWDRDYQEAAARFVAMMARADPETAELLRPLAPSRMLVGSFELAFQTWLTVELQEAFTVRALPINLEFTLRHAARAERYARLSLTVEQVPLTPVTRQA